MKIAVIGTGIAGNVVARHLYREHDITVFEAADYVGGHTHTIDVVLGGERYAIDTGFIVFNDRTYPNFIALLDDLGVASQPTEMSFSVRCERTDLEYNGASLNALFAQRRNLLRPSFHRMLRDIIRFNREAPELLDVGEDSRTLGDVLRAGAYSREFVEHYLVPMGAAIWSAEPENIYRFPAQFFIRFFRNHGLLSINDRPQWRVVAGGSRSYVEALVRPFRDRIRLRSPVCVVTRYADHVEIRSQGGPPERFDCVFIAAHSDQALAMLRDASAQEREVLAAIPYQENDVVLHTDASLLPRRRRAWAAWNYHLFADPQTRVAVTYNMNILQGLDAPAQFLVTLNCAERIDPAKVLARFRYDHPVLLPGSLGQQARMGEISGTRRTFYCGAYWQNGFHEDGVCSAMQALKYFREWVTHGEQPLRRVG
jgi:predicted NAD/FAD-binding protein